MATVSLTILMLMTMIHLLSIQPAVPLTTFFLTSKAFKILMVLSFSITPFPLLVCGFKVGKNMDNNNAGNDDDDDGTVAPFITVLYHQQLY